MGADPFSCRLSPHYDATTPPKFSLKAILSHFLFVSYRISYPSRSTFLAASEWLLAAVGPVHLSSCASIVASIVVCSAHYVLKKISPPVWPCRFSPTYFRCSSPHSRCNSPRRAALARFSWKCRCGPLRSIWSTGRHWSSSRTSPRNPAGPRTRPTPTGPPRLSARRAASCTSPSSREARPSVQGCPFLE